MTRERGPEEVVDLALAPRRRPHRRGERRQRAAAGARLEVDALVRVVRTHPVIDDRGLAVRPRQSPVMVHSRKPRAVISRAIASTSSSGARHPQPVGLRVHLRRSGNRAQAVEEIGGPGGRVSRAAWWLGSLRGGKERVAQMAARRPPAARVAQLVGPERRIRRRRLVSSAEEGLGQGHEWAATPGARLELYLMRHAMEATGRRSPAAACRGW